MNIIYVEGLVWPMYGIIVYYYFRDYQLGINGFEKAKTWKSVEGNRA